MQLGWSEGDWGGWYWGGVEVSATFWGGHSWSEFSWNVQIL